MKSKLIFAFTLTLIFSKVMAQSFSLQTAAGITLNYGDTLVVTGTTNDFQLEGALLVINNSAAQKTVNVERTILNLVAGTDNAFAWGTMMYPPFVNVSVYPSIINAGGIDNTFYTWYFFNGLTGVSYVKYRFYDDANPADSAWMVFQFNVTQAVGINDLIIKNPVTVFPNPSNGIFTISSDEISFNTAAEVYDQIGNLVLIKTISEQLKCFPVDLSNQSVGVYTLKLKDEKSRSTIITKLIKQ